MEEKLKKSKLSDLEQLLGYSFQNQLLLRHALTHSSFANEKFLKRENNNERLEFLGDAVLEFVSSEYLYELEDGMSEGSMTKLRASLVCEQTLAQCARTLNLGSYLLLGKGEALNGGRERDSILSDALEAVIGAIYLDGGITNVKEFVRKHVLSDIENKKLFYDSKTILQEMVQNEYKQQLHYELLAEEGPEHQKCFTVQVYLDDKPLKTGTGKTKKAAEQEAAYKTILYLQEVAGLHKTVAGKTIRQE